MAREIMKPGTSRSISDPNMTTQTMKAQLLKNALFNSSSWGVTLLVNLAAIPILLRHLGVEGYGIYLLLTGLFGYFGLLDFGLSDGVIKYVAHHIELREYESVTESVNAAIFVQLMAGVFGIACLWAFNHQIIHELHVTAALTHAASMGLYISAVGFLCKLLLNTFNAALKGLQRFDVLAKTTVVYSLFNTIASVLVLLAGGGLLEVIVLTVLITTANLATAVFLVFRCFSQYRFSLRVRREAIRALFGFGAYTFVSRVASAVNSYFVQIVIAVILGAAAVPYFAVPLRVTAGMEAGMASLIAVIFPFVSTLKARGNIESLEKLYSDASKYVVALSTPVYLFLILFSRQLLRVWLGPSFAEKGWLVLAFLAGGSLLASWTMVPANTAFGTGDTRVTAAFSAIVMGLNVVFSVLFTLKWGVIGTAAAILVTGAQAPFFIWYVTDRVVRISPGTYFTRVFAFHLIPAFIFSLLSLAVLWGTKTQDRLGLLLALTFGAFFTAAYYALIIARRVVSVGSVGWSG